MASARSRQVENRWLKGRSDEGLISAYDAVIVKRRSLIAVYLLLILAPVLMMLVGPVDSAGFRRIFAVAVVTRHVRFPVN